MYLLQGMIHLILPECVQILSFGSTLALAYGDHMFFYGLEHTYSLRLQYLVGLLKLLKAQP